MTKCGYVSVVGRPNAGKSSLLNWLVGEKIAMVSHKANATRKRSNIIVMHKEDQIVFVDTPGLHETEKLLNQFMLDEALKAMGDCDLILFLAPVTDQVYHYEEFLEKNKKKTKHILLLTKIDFVSNEEVLEKMKEYEKFSCFSSNSTKVMSASDTTVLISSRVMRWWITALRLDSDFTPVCTTNCSFMKAGRR